MGVGDAALNSKAIETAVADLALISGQLPAINKAKKSIAWNFCPCFPLRKLLYLKSRYFRLAYRKLTVN